MISRPPLPMISDGENDHFHPFVRRAIEEAISHRGLSNSYHVEAQYSSPTGPIDLVLVSDQTSKVALVIEVKRTKTSVRGQGRRQARDYWSNLGSRVETAFYCCTNLELIELFRFDPSRPRTASQAIELVVSDCGTLGTTSEGAFYDLLIASFGEILDLIVGAKSYKYASGVEEIHATLGTLIRQPGDWHKTLIPVCFEYIRGAATRVPMLAQKTSGWKAASLYMSRPEEISRLGSAIDFEQIFADPQTIPNDPIAFNTTLIKQAYEAGRALGMGDDIAEAVSDLIASPDDPGVVETDPELARLVAVLARSALGRELKPDEEVMDPAAGSGRLLTALHTDAFRTITPKQLRANEKEPRFAEALSLRLGLTHAEVLSPTNAPLVTIKPAEQLTADEARNVRVIVMNPPYFSGVAAASEKGEITRRTSELSGRPSKLNHGQVAFEILFLEMLWSLVQIDTVIVTVFPVQHLTRLSPEVIDFRKWLTGTFSLSHIVLYPRKGLFSNVIKQTLILVGQKKREKNTHVKLVEVQCAVGDVDFSALITQLETPGNPTYGVEVSDIERSDLDAIADQGWKALIGAGKRAKAFTSSYFKSYNALGDIGGPDIRRGVLGNNGNTSLTVFSRTTPKYSTLVSMIPTSWQMPALNTTESMPRILSKESAPEMSFLPPLEAYVAGSKENVVLRRFVNEYLREYVPTSGAQAKAPKTAEQIIDNLKSNQKDFGAGWAIVQRGSRTKGEVGFQEEGGILLSTNVPMVRFKTERETKLFASWALSIFGQLQFELLATNQEGMRKLELDSLRQLRHPNFLTLEREIADALIANFPLEPAHQFSTITVRPSDELWAKVVWPPNPGACVLECVEVLSSLIAERQGFGN
jgi:hypothetical protein